MAGPPRPERSVVAWGANIPVRVAGICDLRAGRQFWHPTGWPGTRKRPRQATSALAVSVRLGASRGLSRSSPRGRLPFWSSGYAATRGAAALLDSLLPVHLLRSDDRKEQAVDSVRLRPLEDRACRPQRDPPTRPRLDHPGDGGEYPGPVRLRACARARVRAIGSGGCALRSERQSGTIAGL
jgi:hypothetical protein